jgi:hypothetical protein
MHIGKILIYRDESNTTPDMLKKYLSCNEITELRWIIKYIEQGYNTFKSMYYLEGCRYYQVDDTATTNMLIYSGNVVGALEFDEQSFMNFVLCTRLIKFGDLVNNFNANVFDLFDANISNYWSDEPLSDLIEEFQENVTNLFFTPNLIKNPIKTIENHLSNKW